MIKRYLKNHYLLFVIASIIFLLLYIKNFHLINTTSPIKPFAGHFIPINQRGLVEIRVFSDPNPEGNVYKVIAQVDGKMILVDSGTWSESYGEEYLWKPNKRQKIYELKGKYRTTLIDLSASGFAYHVDYINTTVLFKQIASMPNSYIDYEIPDDY